MRSDFETRMRNEDVLKGVKFSLLRLFMKSGLLKQQAGS